MDQRHCGNDPFVKNFLIEGRDLVRQHHALVDDGPGRKRSKIEIAEAVGCFVVFPRCLLADHKQLAFQVVRAGATGAFSNKNLADDGGVLSDGGT